MSLNHISRSHNERDLAHLDSHIQQVDQRSRSFKHRLENHNFFVIGKQRVIPSVPSPRPEHYIITSDTDTAFVGADRLLSGNSTPIRRRLIFTNEMSLRAQTFMAFAQKSLKSMTDQMEPVKFKFWDVVHRCSQADLEIEEELKILRNWLERVERRVEILREDLERITAMEKDGWEVGVIVTTTEEWDFCMRAHQWR